MRKKAEVVKELAEVNAKIDALLAKDEVADDDEQALNDLDARASALQEESAQAERREEIAERNKARQAFLEAPAREPESPVANSAAVSSGLTDLRERDPQGGYARYDDFLRDVREACDPTQPKLSDNLRVIQAAYGQNAEAGSEGGFLTPPDFSNRILEKSAGDLPIIEQCDRLTLSGNSVVITGMADHDKSGTTYRHGGIVVYWVGEGESITRSSLKFRQIVLRLHKMAALSYCTEEELQDVANFGSRLMAKQASGIRDELLEAILFGTGVAKPLGAFVGTSPCVQQSAETGQAADTIVAENIINMNSVIHSPSRSRGVWLYNGECLPQLEAMALSVGTGGVPVFMPAGGLSDASYGRLKGRPAFETDHCEALGDAGDLVFGDFSQYLLATKGTVDTAMSIHLRFDYAETAFRSMFRVDGRPAWDTNLKPRKGASTRRVSPFVKLAART